MKIRMHFIDRIHQLCNCEDAPLDTQEQQARAVQEDVSDRVSFVQGNIEVLPFAYEMFDFLRSRDMLVHMPDLPQALAECARAQTDWSHARLYDHSDRADGAERSGMDV